MKITAPINNIKEASPVIEAGADEIYCGVIDDRWYSKFTNIASPNRREWKSANLKSFKELKEIVKIAASKEVPVYFTLNALYTDKQYPFIYEYIDEAVSCGVKAIIVADLGLIYELNKGKSGIAIHLSTGGTVFNSQTLKFYKDLLVSRIILPRHLMLDEIEVLAKDGAGLELEVFMLNSGCKNIDGFCTFQHGIREYGFSLWNILKKLNFDRYLLRIIKNIPPEIVSNLGLSKIGVDSACLLDYKVSVMKGLDNQEAKIIRENISSAFNLITGVDTCGVCDMYRLKKIGITSIKVIGRNYSMKKKINDVTFLKRALSLLDSNQLNEEGFKRSVKSLYKDVYKTNCDGLCYRAG